MVSPKQIRDVNEMRYEHFMQYLGNIEGLWMASSIWSCRPFSDSKDLHQRVCTLLDEIPLIVKEAVLRGHPDLAGKLAQENKLPAESKQEQAAAGLAVLTPEERQLINDLNQQYTNKFDFPFVLCARENKLNSILQGLQSRINNTREEEVVTGISEIKKICWYRIADLVQSKL